MPVPVATLGMSTRSAGGIKTLSITWITPLDDSTSAVTTLASLTRTLSALTVNVRSSLFSAVAVMPSVKSEDITLPETT